MRLVDGTIVNIAEDAVRKLIQAAKNASEEKDGMVVSIEGYESSSGRKTNVLLRLDYEYIKMVKTAIEEVNSKSFSAKKAKGLFTKEAFTEAKEELLASLHDSLDGDNALDSSSDASTPLDSIVQNIRVGLSSGNIMLRGVIEEYELLKDIPKDTKKRSSSEKTLAKKFLSTNTYREGTIGSIRTYSLSTKNFSSIKIGGETFKSSLFTMDTSVQHKRKKITRNKGVVDCIFVIDTTGSNHSNQPAIRDALDDMLELCTGLDLQVGFIFQGDYCDGDELVTIYPLQSLALGRRILARNHDTGGGDAPEAYEVGLHCALGMNFRDLANAVIVMVTDIYPHEYVSSSLSPYTFVEKVHEATAMDIVIHYLYTHSGSSGGRSWALSMSKLQEKSEFFELSARSDIPYALSAIIAGEAGEIDSFESKAKKLDVISKPIEAAIRIFKAKGKGASKRTLLEKEESLSFEILGQYVNTTKKSISIEEAKSKAKGKPGMLYIELMKQKTYTSNFELGSINDGKLSIQQMKASKTKPLRIGPDASSKVFIKASGSMKVPVGTMIVVVDK